MSWIRLILRNYKQTANATLEQFNFWKPKDSEKKDNGAKIVKPIIVGYHGKPTTFDPATCGHIESHGKPVTPTSLYLAQLTLRLGFTPKWIKQAQ